MLFFGGSSIIMRGSCKDYSGLPFIYASKNYYRWIYKSASPSATKDGKVVGIIGARTTDNASEPSLSWCAPSPISAFAKTYEQEAKGTEMDVDYSDSDCPRYCRLFCI